jgi:hypothetical protein
MLGGFVICYLSIFICHCLRSLGEGIYSAPPRVISHS